MKPIAAICTLLTTTAALSMTVDAIASMKPFPVTEEQKAQFFRAYQKSLVVGESEADNLALKLFLGMTEKERESILFVGSSYCQARTMGMNTMRFMEILRESLNETYSASNSNPAVKAIVSATHFSAVVAAKAELCPHLHD